ncbi:MULTISPECIES: hypothetical protein [Vibrio]|uniref:DUF4760 domain-containing protein n=1 Tax=Vibrio anguillarum TaxID=55601 RepID=A0ABD4QZC4_VIBAN|nr:MULTISPECIES: hypothetical protein [Vibrio]MBT2920573.1 hypothetical protein [Vibrio anguillarum]MDE1334193.1 hypothetical protein [Vibrio aestuarianus]
MEKLKEILEILYLLSGPALVFLAYKALDQIKVAKELAKVSSKREAYKATADECKYYSEKIIPLINNLDSKVKKFDAQIFTKSEVKVENNSISVSPFYKYDHHETAMDEIYLDLSAVINALSDFSTYFMSGVADERLAFKSLSYTYCDTVKKYAPVLIPLVKNEDSTLQLFIIWNTRIEKQKAIEEKKKLEEKIKKTTDITINPIGT